MQQPSSDQGKFPYILLHPSDNVVVAIRPVDKNTELVVEGRILMVERRIELGHKIAIKDIQEGEKIIKSGTVIGSATTIIRPGEHVHLHNMKSDYLPTYTLDDAYHE